MPERIDDAGHRSEIAHPKEFFGQGGFCAYWGFWVTFEDLLGHPCQIFLACLQDVRVHASYCGGLPRKINEP